MVSFVVLHYNDIAITKKCIDYLLKMKDIENNSIILIDNASPNGSGPELKKQYENNEIVDVILITENVGFAKGNDIGYYFAKKKGNMDYIVVMNNDVMIKDEGFIDKLNKSGLSQKTEIVMPEIINKSGKKQNPYRIKHVDTKEINKMFLVKIMLLIAYSIPIVCNWMIKRNNKKGKQGTSEYDGIDNYTEMLVPHGSCIIYTKKWIDMEKIAFIPDTFMYHEEDILYEYILNKKYKTLFCKDFSVLHMEDVSTNSIAQTKLKKSRFYLKNSIKPVLVFRKIRYYNDKQKKFTVNYHIIEKIIDNGIIR